MIFATTKKNLKKRQVWKKSVDNNSITLTQENQLMKKITLKEINTSRSKKSLPRVLWIDYKAMSADQKSKLFSETK